jgi:hypothetical protein
MSVTEIIQEIPKLSLEELRYLAAKISELEPGRETFKKSGQLATQTQRLLIRLEEKNARRANPRVSD